MHVLSQYMITPPSSHSAQAQSLARQSTPDSSPAPSSSPWLAPPLPPLPLPTSSSPTLPSRLPSQGPPSPAAAAAAPTQPLTPLAVTASPSEGSGALGSPPQLPPSPLRASDTGLRPGRCRLGTTPASVASAQGAASLAGLARLRPANSTMASRPTRSVSLSTLSALVECRLMAVAAAGVGLLQLRLGCAGWLATGRRCCADAFPAAAALAGASVGVSDAAAGRAVLGERSSSLAACARMAAAAAFWHRLVAPTAAGCTAPAMTAAPVQALKCGCVDVSEGCGAGLAGDCCTPCSARTSLTACATSHASHCPSAILTVRLGLPEHARSPHCNADLQCQAGAIPDLQRVSG